jgi:dTDP-4-amino-4,6-dideoxygalactose transaminase
MEKDILIPFNKPFLTGKETHYIHEAIKLGKISGNGYFTKKCQHFFEERYGFKKALLTTSCTDALEMAAILANIKAGDEVIIPSYTFRIHRSCICATRVPKLFLLIPTKIIQIWM